MQLDPLWFAVEQLKRILESFGWKVTAQNTQGPNVVVTIEKSKESIISPK